MSNAKSKLETGLVRELASILRDADLGEIEVEHDGLRVRVSKPAVTVAATVPAAPQASLPVAPMAPPAAAMTTETTLPAAADTAIPANAVTSPMVGTAYLSSEPGTKPFISVGDKVKAGDTLLLVEAMKTFNPVDAPTNGTVTAILVGDAQPVEYGEALVVIE